MLEKYHDWTYHPTERFNTEALPQTISAKEFLTQVSLYWLTNSMSSSIRIYYECLQQNEMIKVVIPRVKIPVAVCAFAHDISRVCFHLYSYVFLYYMLTACPFFFCRCQRIG
jgi:hypothetical protein